MTRLPENVSWGPKPERDPLHHWRTLLPEPHAALRHSLQDRSWAAVLLTTLFGPRVTPTARGLSVARVALALAALAAVVVLVVLLNGAADFLVDPTP